MSPRRASWSVTPLGELVEVLDFARIPVSASERAKRLGSVPYYGAAGQVGWIDKPLFDEPLVLLGEDGVQFFDSMKSKAYSISGPAWVNNHAHVLRARPAIDRRYLLHFLNQFDYRSFANGTTRLKLTQAAMRRMPINYPELEEQRRIVDILEDHISRLDASDSLLTAALLRLRVLHKSVLLDLIPDATSYPVHWNHSTVSEAGNVTLGRQRHPDWHNGPNMHPYLRVANVFEDRIDLSDVKEMHWPDDSFNRFRLKPGDVLLNEGQSPEFLGRPAMYTGTPVDIAFTNTLIRFQANDGVLPEFALLVFRRHMHAGRFAQESRITTNIAHLSASRLKPIEFPIPPLDEQKQLAGLAEQQLGDASRLGDQVHLLKLKSKVLRRALLGAAFSGRLAGKSIDMEMVEEMAGV